MSPNRSLSLLALSRQATEIPPEKFHTGMSYWYVLSVLSDEFSRESILQSEMLQISTVLSHQNEMSQVDRISEVCRATGEKLSLRKQKSIHREHTLLLNGKRVNKGMKRTNSWIVYLCLLLLLRENRYLQVLRSTVSLNSYLGFSALCENFFYFMFFHSFIYSLPIQ